MELPKDTPNSPHIKSEGATTARTKDLGGDKDYSRVD